MFRNQQFFYTLTPPLLGEDPIDDFLFNTRSGFCEHYASAFVFLMRAAGIPARVVTGYQGGEVNPIGDYMIVRQSEAHAWAEVWLEGEGWLRVDPTAAVSPLRVESGIAAPCHRPMPCPSSSAAGRDWLRNCVSPGIRSRTPGTSGCSATTPTGSLAALPRRPRPRDLADAGDDSGRDHRAASRPRSPSRPAPVPQPPPRDPVAESTARFCRKLARRGAMRAPSEGPVHFAERASRALPEAAAPIRTITESTSNCATERCRARNPRVDCASSSPRCESKGELLQRA